MTATKPSSPPALPLGYGLLDPEADITYTVTGWGLQRFDNLDGGVPGAVNYTLTTKLEADGITLDSTLVYDKGIPPQAGNFKYVNVLDPRPMPADGWPTLHPQVSWKNYPDGSPEFIPGVACLSDDMSLGSAVMPNLPGTHGTPFPGFPDDANYPNGSPAKMCIAQVGWAPVVDMPGYIKFWAIVIDQADSAIKYP